MNIDPNVNEATEFSTINPVYYWTQRVLPLVYEDNLTKTEIMGKIIYTLNQLIKDVNLIPSLIAEMIKEYITSGALEKVITEILLNTMINVKYPPNDLPPAKGDGTTDDTATIQGCIDYANTIGGMVYFPYGKYLTGPLTVYSDISLKGSDMYTTSIVAKGGSEGALISASGTVEGFSIKDMTINVNPGAQVNNVDGITLSCGMSNFHNLVIDGGYTGMNIEKTGYVSMETIVLQNSATYHMSIGGTTGHIVAHNLNFGRLTPTLAEACLMTDANNDRFIDFIMDTASPVGIECHGNGNLFSGYINKAVSAYENYGAYNTFDIQGVSLSFDIHGDLTASGDNVSVTGNSSATVTGATTTISSENKTSITGATTTISSENKTSITGATTTISSENKTSISSISSVDVAGEDVILNPTNPLTYKTPVPFNKYFNSVDMKDANSIYKVLVAGDKISELGAGIITPEDYGAVGDGITDDTQAIKDMIADIYSKAPMIALRPTLSLPDLRAFTIFMKGVYLISEPMTFTSGFGLTLYNVNLIASQTFTGTGLLMFTVDMRNCNVCNGKLMCNYHCDEAISLTAYNLAFIIDNVQIFSYRKIGIHNSGNGFETVISNCNINQVEYGHLNDNPYPVTEGTGIKIESNHTDCHILSTVTSYNFNYEVYIEGGVSTVADCHFYGRTSACFIGPYHELTNVYFDNVPVEIADNNAFNNCVFSRSVNNIPYLIKLAVASYYYTRFVNCTFRGQSTQTVFDDSGATSKFIGIINSSFVGIPYARYQTERSTGWQPWTDTDITYGNPGGAQIGQLVFDWGKATAVGTITLPRPFDLDPFFVSVTPIDSGTIKVDSYTKDSITVSGTSTNFMWFALGTT